MNLTRDVLRLVEQLAEKTGQILDYAGFGKMSDLIDAEHITQRYLDDLYRDMKKNEQAGKLKTGKRTYYLDPVASYLGYKNFSQFVLSLNTAKSAALMSCAGNWWSYVRDNSGNGLLKAPVKIFLDENRQQMRMELKGSERNFFGEVEDKGGCLSGFLVSGTDKKIGLMFRLGNTRNMEVLQGVFCGISSSGDPIAGRELLVREKHREYSMMQWSRHTLHDEEIDHNIRKYFADHALNCLKVKEIKGFDLASLGPWE